METEQTPPERPERWHRSRMIMRNPISLAGMALAIVSLANIFIFVLIDQIAIKASPYIGILAYMVSPAFLVFGLFLMFVGVLLERRKKVAPTAFYPRIDLNDPTQRSAVISFMTFLVVFVMVSVAGSYKAYEFTESVQFCGQLCHTVMSPEYTAYQLSPHARVACAECHVGAGATWFVKSKLSGSSPGVRRAFNTFPRPIPTPVHNLRPAQETCEQCHWPKKFYGGQLKVFTHYASDEKNTLRQIRMIIKTGGGDPATGAPEGIHWHMNIANEIDYVAADEKHQVIPYIHVEDLQGRVTEYYAKDSTLTKDQIAKAASIAWIASTATTVPRTSTFRPTWPSINPCSRAASTSPCPSSSRKRSRCSPRNYDTTDAAMQGIAKGHARFLREANIPTSRRPSSSRFATPSTEVQQIFKRTTFPEMKLNWQTHPNNLGHFYYTGCFRCHDGQHVSADGKVISRDCNQCHTLLSETDGASSVAATASPAFQHPVDIGRSDPSKLRRLSHRRRRPVRGQRRDFFADQMRPQRLSQASLPQLGDSFGA